MTNIDAKYIATVAEEKSITKAAKKLFIAQPTLSQCIQKLENEFQTTLFTRSSNGVELTQAGECFVNMAKKMLQIYEDFEKKLSYIDGMKERTFVIGVPSVHGARVIPIVLPKLKELHPHIQVDVIEGTSDEIENYILEGKIDFGILHFPIISSNIEYSIFSEERFMIALRQGSPLEGNVYYKGKENIPYIDVRDLANEPIILTYPTQRSRMICNKIFESAGIVPNVIQTFKYIDTLVSLAATGFATTLIPQTYFRNKNINVKCFMIDEKYEPKSYSVVAYSKGTCLCEVVKGLISILKETTCK